MGSGQSERQAARLVLRPAWPASSLRTGRSRPLDPHAAPPTVPGRDGHGLATARPQFPLSGAPAQRRGRTDRRMDGRADRRMDGQGWLPVGGAGQQSRSRSLLPEAPRKGPVPRASCPHPRGAAGGPSWPQASSPACLWVTPGAPPGTITPPGPSHSWLLFPMTRVLWEGPSPGGEGGLSGSEFGGLAGGSCQRGGEPSGSPTSRRSPRRCPRRRLTQHPTPPHTRSTGRGTGRGPAGTGDWDRGVRASGSMEGLQAGATRGEGGGPR